MISDQTITKNQKIVQREGNIISDMAGETVMLNIQNGKYYNLGIVGGVIWNFLRTPITVSQLIDDLRSEYEVSYNECEEQVLSFLEVLLKENLILVEN